MREITTIKLTKKTVELLNKLKTHPRQSYEEAIVGLLRKARLDEKAAKQYFSETKREVTTIKLTKGTVKGLSKLKVHPRQSYEEIVLKLLPKANLHNRAKKRGKA